RTKKKRRTDNILVCLTRYTSLQWVLKDMPSLFQQIHLRWGGGLFNTIAATVYEHYDEIVNFFINRSTNASAEAFNAKIKAFRTSLRGATDVKCFLFRLTKIYA
ncbi:hypothetical protein EZS27_036415, partial [termite gut metagenome]